MKLLTKKSILFESSSLFLISSVLIGIARSEVCYYNHACNSFFYRVGDFGIFLFLPLLILPFSLITYKLSAPVFVSWRNFAIFAIPVVVAITIPLVMYDTSSGFGGLIEEQIILLTLATLYTLYFLTSLIIIIRAWWKSRKSH